MIWNFSSRVQLVIIIIIIIIIIISNAFAALTREIASLTLEEKVQFYAHPCINYPSYAICKDYLFHTVFR